MSELAKTHLRAGRRRSSARHARTLCVCSNCAAPRAPDHSLITEELWQKIAPLQGNGARASCWSPSQGGYQPARPPGAAKVAALKTLVNACRALRSEMQLSPAEKVRAISRVMCECRRGRVAPYLIGGWRDYPSHVRRRIAEIACTGESLVRFASCWTSDRTVAAECARLGRESTGCRRVSQA